MLMKLFVTKSLLKGKKVLVPVESFDFHQFKQTSKSPIVSRSSRTVRKASRYGVQFYKKEELLSLLEESLVEKTINL